MTIYVVVTFTLMWGCKTR